MSKVQMVLGFPASGKSTFTKRFIEQSYLNLNRDTEGGSIAGLLPKFEAYLKDNKDVVLDNLFPTVEVRKPFIELAKKYKAAIGAVQMATSIEDSQFNFVQRMIDIKGKLLMPEEIKAAKHPNIFPPTVFFKYKKDFQMPSIEEGFDSISDVRFFRKDNLDFTNKALILDFDGTLRECINGNGKYPTDFHHIEIKANRTKILQEYENKGYRLLGVSNQSGVHKGELTYEKAVELFEETNKRLGIGIEVSFCPHQSNPLSCYCRKPQVGAGVHFINRHKLSRKDCIFVGDMTTDKTFAKRCGFQYVDQAEFFK